MRNIEEAMSVGNEEESKRDERRLKRIKVEEEKYHNWIWGIVISFLPILALPFEDFIRSGNIFKMLYRLFCDSSVIFIGISFTITALNDFVGYGKNEKRWMNSNFFLLILGTIFYTVVTMRKDKNLDINMTVVFWFDLIYFIVMVLLGANRYIDAIREAK